MKSFSLFLFAALLAGEPGAFAQPNYTTGQAARAVIGQPRFDAQNQNSSDTVLGAASGIAYAADTLFVADDNLVQATPQNNRVLLFKNLSNQLPPPTAQPPYNSTCPVCVGQANVVLGQPDMTTTVQNNSATQNNLRQPTAVASDGVHLVVADTNHNRVLIWNSIPTTNNQPADVVVGQPNFTSTSIPGATTPTATSLRSPQGVWIQNGQLFIADTGYNRVLIYNHIPTTNGAAADVALGAPNLTTDIPALLDLARENEVPICGKDFKTGQTYMKTLLAPGFKARMLGVKGWFSTNILGNRDGEVLDDPGSFKTKEETKLSVLEHILQPDLYPQLYKDLYHAVRINYYPPRGDAKEGWDNIDIFGWLGYPMQIKIDFLCRDSILAAPLVLDLVLFLDLAQRAGMRGIQEWLSFYFKGPMTAPGLYPEHDIFIQLMKLKNTLRWMRGEDLITHLGLEYYD